MDTKNITVIIGGINAHDSMKILDSMDTKYF